MRNFWESIFAQYPDAEGIDFVDVLAKPWKIERIFASHSKEEMLAGCSYPRSGYFLWKRVNGKKVYLYDKSRYEEPDSQVNCSFQNVLKQKDHTVHWVIIDKYDEPKYVGSFTNRATAEEMCLALTEERAYEDAYESYYYHRYRGSWERVYNIAWQNCLFDYDVVEIKNWDF